MARLAGIPAFALVLGVALAILFNIHDDLRERAELAAYDLGLISSLNSDTVKLDRCPGYRATNIVRTSPNSFTAELKLAGRPCNVYGNDVELLNLTVEYETKSRIHVRITDPSMDRYEVPESVLPRPKANPDVDRTTADIRFVFTPSPFSFSIVRASSGEVLFDTTSHPLIFEPQYLRLKTSLPKHANLYGLGEHSDTFRLPTKRYTRTLWSRDAFGLPSRTNLYGNHPVYFEHRTTGTHGVFLLNSNGMDVKLNERRGKTTLEYNVIGGVLDLYFLGGSTEDPREVARQYADVVGRPAEVPYWSLGFHQCRFGYKDYTEVAHVITNYSAANIPLETMWIDIDYMYERRIFTVDPSYFPLARVREIVKYLHDHDQKFILMTDPAVAHAPSENYGPFGRASRVEWRWT